MVGHGSGQLLSKAFFSPVFTVQMEHRVPVQRGRPRPHRKPQPKALRVLCQVAGGWKSTAVFVPSKPYRVTQHTVAVLGTIKSALAKYE